MAQNPFQESIDAANKAANDKLNEALSASGSQRDALLDEFDRLNERASKLIRLGLDWLEDKLRTIVTDVEKMARDEVARQSAIGTRLAELANNLRGEIGLGPMPRGNDPSTPIPSPPADTSPTAARAEPRLPTAPAPQAPTLPAPVPVTETRPAVDPKKRDVDLTRLHPTMRAKVERLLEDLQTQSVPMKIFEAYRPPERQQFLYAKGRTTAGGIVTNAEPWSSFHQYGLAVDMVIDKAGFGMWDESPQGNQWWDAYHRIARKHGLEPISWEKPHIQLSDLSYQSLMAGEYPPGSDDSWADNLVAAVDGWPGLKKPRSPDDLDRPPLRVASPTVARSRDRLPSKPVHDWMNFNGGQEWRVDGNGLYLRSVDGGVSPVRTAGSPVTATAILNAFGDDIADASIRFQVPPELLLMIIATEAAAFRQEGFTGPRTFRWEPSIKDYSAGPMQILSGTARDVNSSESLGLDDTMMPPMKKKPANPPGDLLLYESKAAITIGAAYISRNAKRLDTGNNPIFVSAAFNAGSLRSSPTNLWRIHVFGSHLDRAAEWYSDACIVCDEHLRR